MFGAVAVLWCSCRQDLLLRNLTLNISCLVIILVFVAVLTNVKDIHESREILLTVIFSATNHLRFCNFQTLRKVRKL